MVFAAGLGTCETDAMMSPNTGTPRYAYAPSMPWKDGLDLQLETVLLGFC